MEKEEQKIILLQCLEFYSESDNSDLKFMDTSLSNDSEEEETENYVKIISLYLNERTGEMHIRLRVKDYVERIVPNYTAKEFKMHFRYS